MKCLNCPVSYLITTGTVMAGEAAVLFIAGIPAFKFGILKNERLASLLKSL